MDKDFIRLLDGEAADYLRRLERRVRELEARETGAGPLGEWQDAALGTDYTANGWSVTETIRYRLSEDLTLLYIVGRISGGSATPSNTDDIFVLPEDYRPVRRGVAIAYTGNDEPSVMNIYPTGEVRIINTTNLTVPLTFIFSAVVPL